MSTETTSVIVSASIAIISGVGTIASVFYSLGRLVHRFEALEESTKGQFETMERRIDQVEQRVTNRVDRLETRFDDLLLHLPKHMSHTK